MEKSITCYCDCSYDAHKHIAGIGILVQKGVKQKAISNYIPAPNNNYGELFAIYLTGVMLGGEKATIYSDSKNAISYINNEIKEKPRTREQYEAHQMMKVLAWKVRQMKNLDIVWTKGHRQQYLEQAVNNNLADGLARQGRAKFLTRRER